MLRVSRSIFSTAARRSVRSLVQRPIVSGLRHGYARSMSYTSSQNSRNLFKTTLPVRTFSTDTKMVSVEFKLADIGEGIAECEVIQWFVKPGDKIAQFDKVCEVQSDKATVEITSRFDGTITKLFYEQGDMAIVGEPLILLDVDPATLEDELVSSAAAEQPAETTRAQAETPAPEHIVSSSGRVLCSPAVRHLAKINAIDLSTVNGSGPKGRILKEDVLRVIENGNEPTQTSTSSSTSAPPAFRAPPTIPSAPPAAAAPAQAASKAAPVFVNRYQYTGADNALPISGLDRIMVKTMDASNAVPQLGYSDEYDVGALNGLRKQLKPVVAQYGCGLSNLPILMKAASLSLLQFPQLNAHVNTECTEVVHRAAHNIGIAVDTPRGLLVPNVKNCESKSILEIALEVARLAALGRDGKLGKEDLTGGTFTLSNIGSIGGTYASPLVVVPEVMIGALGKFQTLPRFNEKGEVVKAEIMVISWSADHRVVDGASVARFSNAFKGYIEDPSTMLLHAK